MQFLKKFESTSPQQLHQLHLCTQTQCWILILCCLRTLQDTRLEPIKNANPPVDLLSFVLPSLSAFEKAAWYNVLGISKFFSLLPNAQLLEYEGTDTPYLLNRLCQV
jgi:hypothetical protein